MGSKMCLVFKYRHFPLPMIMGERVISLTNHHHLGVSKNRGTPKWMVKIMENTIKMDDLGGFPIFLG